MRTRLVRALKLRGELMQPGVADAERFQLLHRSQNVIAARAGAGDYRATPAESRMGEGRSCPGGMCSNPGVCGMN